MEKTPLQLTVTKLQEKVDTSAGLEQIIAYQKAVDIVKSLFVYEQKDRRNVAEKAWIAHEQYVFDNPFDTTDIAKQTYLNQNHPL